MLYMKTSYLVVFRCSRKLREDGNVKPYRVYHNWNFYFPIACQHWSFRTFISTSWRLLPYLLLQRNSMNITFSTDRTKCLGNMQLSSKLQKKRQTICLYLSAKWHSGLKLALKDMFCIIFELTGDQSDNRFLLVDKYFPFRFVHF